MFKLDNDFLVSLGLGTLPVEEKNKLLQHIYERLEMNVGMRLAEKMTDAQLDEFEGFIDRNDEAGALRWLETNFPNYKQVVAEELEKLKTEVAQAAPHILAAAQTGPAPQQPAVPQPAQAAPMPDQQANPQYQQYQPAAPQADPSQNFTPAPQQPQFPPAQPPQPPFQQQDTGFPPAPSQQPPAGQPPAGFPPAY